MYVNGFPPRFMNGRFWYWFDYNKTWQPMAVAPNGFLLPIAVVAF